MKIPAISGKKVVTILKKMGFETSHQKGSHIKLIKETSEKKYIIIVPLHPELKKKTLLSILSAADITLEQFLDII